MSNKIVHCIAMDFLRKFVDGLVMVILIALALVVLGLFFCLTYVIYHEGLGLNLFWTVILSIVTFVVAYRFWDLLGGDA